MVIKISDKKLHADTYRAMKYYDKMALKAYSRGDMISGKRWEKKSDKLYGKNYGRMFGLKRINNKWVKN